MSQPALRSAPQPTERQQHIDEIKRLLAEDGFGEGHVSNHGARAADGRARSREGPGSLCHLVARENRRRQIFSDMSLYGLTADDLAAILAAQQRVELARGRNEKP